MPPRPIALVTGSGKRRVGRAIAEALAARGYDLAIHYHRSADDAAELCGALAVRAVLFQADFSRSNEAESLIEQVLKEFGRIDVLVNSAAVWESKPLEQVTAEDVRKHFEINTLATFICAQQAGLTMVQQPQGGVIINLGDWAIERPYRDYAAYFPSKGSIPALTRSLAVELGTRNPAVRVNCILPGPVLFQEDESEASRAVSIQGTLVKRPGRPENIAQAVLSLIDNDFVTGVCLPVDGGRSVYAED